MNDDAYDAQVVRLGDAVRAVVSGEVDLLTEPDLVGKVAEVMVGPGVTSVVIDLRDVTFMDSSGLRALLKCKDQADRRQACFVLAVVDGPVTRLLDATGVRGWFAYE